MRRRSMELAIPIYVDDPPHPADSRFSSAEDEEEDQPPPLPRTPEPSFSRSTSSWLSPISTISNDFRFLDESPGIPLTSSSSDFEHCSGPEGEWSDPLMAKVDVRSEALSSVGISPSYFTNTGSLESLEGGPSSSTGDDITTGTSGSGMPLSHTSQPSLYYHFLDSENQLSDANRSKSVDDITNTPKVFVPDPYHSLDRMRRGSNASNNNNTDKVSYAVLPENSYVESDPEEGVPIEEEHHEEDKYFGEDVQDLLNNSDFSIPDSPSANWQDDRDLNNSRVTELPSISEESEDNNRSRRSSMNVGAQQPRTSFDFNLPEPQEIAPGTFKSSAVIDWSDKPSVSGDNQIFHRRVVSDNHVDYGKKSEEELCSPRSEISEPTQPKMILLRDAPGRASQTGRCQSQVVLNYTEEESPASMNDRSLSNSDPDLNKDLASSVPQQGPPPVFLTRRNSSMKSHPGGSWQTLFGHGNATPHHVVTPATASLSASSISSRSNSRTNVVGDSTVNGDDSPASALTRSSSSSSIVAFMRRSMRRLSGGSRADSLTPSPEMIREIHELQETGTLRRRATTPYRKRSRLKMMRDRSRVEKKNKEKSGSDTFSSISNIFGIKKNKKERMGLDNVINGYSRSAGSTPTSSTMPARRSGDSRPGIPSFFDGLPDNMSAVFSPTGTYEEEDQGSEKADVMTILMDNPRYARLELFTPPSYISWHEKFRHDKLSSKAVKKQDAIFELIHLERQHCANLAFLLDGYRRPLLERNILTIEELNILIPDVIDSLLLFHCHLLDQLLARQLEKNEVDTISDILLKELSEEGTHTSVATQAYTDFGSGKTKSESMMNLLMTRNVRFNDFMKRCSRDKVYKQYDFKAITTRIISRPTKYGLLIETILKNETNQFTAEAELSDKARLAVKRFAMRIDNNLTVVQVTKRWDIVRAHFDSSSQTVIYVPDERLTGLSIGFVKLNWTIEDICFAMGETGRRVLSIGECNGKTGSARAIPITCVCFDDILVCLSKKSNGKYIFAPFEQPVLCVANQIVRNLATHRLTIVLVSGVKPNLLEIEFHNKQTFHTWQKILDHAIAHPTKVRLRQQSADECLRQATIAHELAEKKQKEAEEVWMNKLVRLFESRSEQESRLVNDYISKRMHFVDDIQQLLAEMPLRGRPDLIERVRESVRSKFKEMRNLKTVPVKKLVEDMTHAKETVLWSYLDELEDVARCDSDGSGSDSSGSGRSRPRRIKTFHGTGESTSNKHQKGSIRRHTTVPRMKEDVELGEESDDAKRERESAEEQAHELPLTQSFASHRECRRLLKDLERLKSENIALRNDLALDKLRITSLERMRSSSTTVLSTNVETLEALRRKEKDVREDEQRRKQRLEEFEKELQERSEKMEEERAQWEQQKLREKLDHQRREADLEEKWAVLKEAERRGESSPSRITSRQRISMNDYVAKAPSHPVPVQMMTPELKSLTVKTEIRKKK